MHAEVAWRALQGIGRASGGGSGGLEQRQDRPTVQRLDWRIARRLGLVAFLAYLPFVHGHFTGTDEMGVFLTARALYTEGSFEVRAGPHRFAGRDGRTYAHFAPGLSLLALPFYAAGDVASRVLPEPWLRALSGRPREDDRIDTLGSPQTFAVSLYPVLASAVLVALFFVTERRLGVGVGSALAASVLLGAASYVAAHAVYFLRHTTEAITLLASFAALRVYRAEGRPRDLALGSLWASLTLLVAVPATVVVPALAGYGIFAAWPRLREADLRGRLRLLAAGALPAAAVVTVHVAHNHALWGTLLDSPMVAQRSGFTTPLSVGLWGFLGSPGASLFVYSPLLLLLGATLPPFWRERRAECVLVIAASLSMLLFCAPFSYWHGLWSSPGPRYLFVLTPLLMLPLGRWLDGPPGPWGRRGLFTLAAVGLAVQVVLLLSRWSAVIRGMHYQEAAQRGDLSFLFVPGRSPLVGSARILAEGGIDTWLWGLARGFGEGAGAPGAAALLLGLWAVAFGFAVARLRRAARDT